MPQFKPSDIPKLSDSELEEFLNITIAELIPGQGRIQETLYRENVCIVADLLKKDKDTLTSLGIKAYKLIGDALLDAIHALIEQRSESPQP